MKELSSILSSQWVWTQHITGSGFPQGVSYASLHIISLIHTWCQWRIWARVEKVPKSLSLWCDLNLLRSYSIVCQNSCLSEHLSPSTNASLSLSSDRGAAAYTLVCTLSCFRGTVRGKNTQGYCKYRMHVSTSTDTLSDCIYTQWVWQYVVVLSIHK